MSTRRPAPSATPGRSGSAFPSEPSLRSVFSVRALQVSLDSPDAGVFEIPATNSSQDQGARAVELGDVRRATGFEPVAPSMVGGLDRYRVVLPRDDAGGTLVAYADGLAFLNLGETRSWNGDAPFGPVGVQAEEISLTGGGVAYYEPASRDHGRRVAIHAAGTDLYLESNLPRSELLAAAAALPVQGLPMPDAWTHRRVGAATAERVSLETARASVPFPIELPTALPAGFGLASVELLDAGFGAGVTLYLRDEDADGGIGTIRLHLEAASALPPATSAAQSRVEVGRCAGPVHPRPVAAGMDRRRAVSLARRSRARSRGAPGDRDLDRRGRDGGMSRHRAAGVAAGVAMGFALGASVTLAIQGWATLPDPGSVAQPTIPRTEPEPPEAFLVWTSGGMPEGFRGAVRRLDGIQRSVVIASDNTWLDRSWSEQGEVVDDPRPGFAIPLEVAAVEPEEIAPFLPPADRSAALALADGQGILGESSARLRGLGPGAVLRFGDRPDRGGGDPARRAGRRARADGLA